MCGSVKKLSAGDGWEVDGVLFVEVVLVFFDEVPNV